MTLEYQIRKISYHHEIDKVHSSSTELTVTDKFLIFVNNLRDYVEQHNKEKDEHNKLIMRLDSANSGDNGLQETLDMHISFRIPSSYDVEILKCLERNLADGATITEE